MIISIYKREYNSDRRRKFLSYQNIDSLRLLCKIRENITPIGDGNSSSQYFIFPKNVALDKREYNSDRRRKFYILVQFFQSYTNEIRENITPIGDGNLISYLEIIDRRTNIYKREYNSDRRRK